ALGGGADVRLAGPLPEAEQGLREADGDQRGSGPGQRGPPHAPPTQTRARPRQVSLQTTSKPSCLRLLEQSLTSIYFYCSRKSIMPFSSTADLVVFGFCPVISVPLFLLICSLPYWLRIIISILHVTFTPILLFIYSLYFVGFFFGEWL